MSIAPAVGRSSLARFVPLLLWALSLQQPTCHGLSLGHGSAPKPTTNGSLTRKDLFTNALKSCAVVAATGGLGFPTAAMAEEEAATEAVSTPAVSIASCPKAVSGRPNNCVSTASVRQLDNYMAPWTFPRDMPTQEVLARLKGAVGTNNKLTIIGQTDTTLKVEAIRNFAKDEIVFLVNPEDRVITFLSQQVDGPEGTPDFGENRKRLDDIRRRVGVFGAMGEDISYTGSPRQGALGQLKSFYGLQSGRGFEDVFLEEEDQ
uniref:DUF1995 domain-containing protein n=1 Tax=Entomoneis paludosa TaxID=265537 RepID=A0A7S2Y2C8_9STRA